VRGVLALLLGLAGLILLLSGRANALGGGQIAGVVLALAAAILFALGTVVNGRPLPLAPIASTAWQVGLGCLPMILIGLLFEHPNFGALTGLGVASMAYMTMFPMGVCYLTWFAALRRLTPSAASTGMLLVPILGTLAATAILGELLGLRVLGSMALTLCGVTLALKRG
jgi:drug/metabolite transporter (DMT)-like permease